jgi:4-carboxymuconolactone decarboxylase
MARMPDPLDTLTPEARAVYDRIAARRGAIRGPFAPLMHHPMLAEPVAAVGEYLRFGSTLPGDVRELAILLTARSVSQPFEWVMHAPIALAAGLPPEVVDAVRDGRDPGALPPRYAAPARAVQHVLRFESIPGALQEALQAELGVAGVIELVVLAGYYRLIAGVLFAFDVPLPEGQPRPF